MMLGKSKRFTKLQNRLSEAEEPFSLLLHPMDNPNTYDKEHFMKRNMGSLDRALRVLAAAIVGILYFTNQMSGVAAIILGVVAVVFVLTSVVAVCPLYMPLKFSTITKKDA
jgi:small-conductance mechanosensitive channel